MRTFEEDVRVLISRIKKGMEWLLINWKQRMQPRTAGDAARGDLRIGHRTSRFGSADPKEPNDVVPDTVMCD